MMNDEILGTGQYSQKGLRVIECPCESNARSKDSGVVDEVERIFSQYLEKDFVVVNYEDLLDKSVSGVAESIIIASDEGSRGVNYRLRDYEESLKWLHTSDLGAALDTEIIKQRYDIRATHTNDTNDGKFFILGKRD